MDWIGAALAFALTMLALSLVVTSTVETIHRCGGLREKGLRLMFEHFYERVIVTHIGHVAHASLPESAESQRDAEKTKTPPQTPKGIFLDLMTTNRAPSGHRIVNRIWSGDKLGDLPLDAFMARLGDSEFGDVIARLERDMGKDAVNAVLRDLGHKFEDFGQEASVYFQARARLLSVLVAFVVAWVCHVHPRELMSTFLHNPKITADVIANAPKVIKQLDEQIAAAKAEGEEETAKAKEPEDKAEAEKEAEARLTDIRNTKDQVVRSLAASGVPLGWTQDRADAAGFTLAYGVPMPIWDTATAAKATATSAWLFLGGLLVGLGAPFWRDLVLSLTRLRGGAATEKRKAEDKETAAPGVDRIEAAIGRFLTASRARAIVNGDATGEIDTDVAVG